MNSRRGITLVELLATLSLLAVISVISMSWMATVLRSQSRSEMDANWERASTSVLDLIGWDILSVDRLYGEGRAQSPRFVVGENTLRIRTRGNSGVGGHRYAFDPTTGNMSRQDDSGGKDAGNGRVLLGLVESFGVKLEFPSEQRLLPILRVSLVGQDGHHAERTYILEMEDVQ